MTTFDPITYSAVNNLKAITTGSSAPIGSLVLVPENFSDPDYVETGQSIDALIYPELAATLTNRVNPTDVAVTQTIPPIQAIEGNDYVTTGYINYSCVYNGDLFIFFSNGYVYRTTGGNVNSITFFRIIPLPPPDPAAFTHSEFNYVTVANNYLYISFSTTNTDGKFRMSMADFVNGGTSWTTISIPTWANNAIMFYYGDGVYIAAKNNNTSAGYIARSTDGINFTLINANYTSTNTINGVLYNGTAWVLYGGLAATIAVTSTDGGLTWTARTLGGNSTFQAGVWAPTINLFVLWQATSTTVVYTSPDGATWTSVTGLPTGYVSSATACMTVTPNGTIIGYGSKRNQDWNGLTSYVIKSTDGVNFTNIGGNAPFVNNYGGASFASHVAVLNNTFVYFGTALYSRQNSSSWNTVYSNTQSDPIQWCYCSSTDGFTTFTSFDTITNTSLATCVRAPLFLTSNLGIALAANSTGSNIEYMGIKFYGIITTDGGTSWSPLTITAAAPMRLRTFTIAAGKFVIIGYWFFNQYTNGGMIYGTSTDGVSWTWQRSSGTLTLPKSVMVDPYDGVYYSSLNQSNTSTAFSPNRSTTGATYPSMAATLDFQLTTASGNCLGYTKVGYGNVYIIANGSNPQARVYNSATGFVNIISLPSTFSIGTQGTFTYTQLTFAANQYKVVMMINGIPYVYISYDNGGTWETYSTPFTTSSSAEILLTNDLIIVTNPGLYGSKIYSSETGEDWTTLNLSGITYGVSASTYDGSKIFYAGPMTANSAFIRTTKPATKFIPYVESTIAGSKWVVKAKQA